MKKMIFPLIALTFVFASCEQQHQGMSENDMKVKVDSIVGTKQVDLIQEADADLQNRAPIEVKQKADSIVAAVTASN